LLSNLLKALGAASHNFNELTPLAKAREDVDPPRVLEQAKVMHGRAAYPNEVANVVGLLCLPYSSWITGKCHSCQWRMRFSQITSIVSSLMVNE